MIFQRMIDRLTGQPARAAHPRKRVSTRRGNNARRLSLEALQKRELFASDLGAISGTAFVDANDNQTYDVGETLLKNVEVKLYLDDVTQNGLVDSGETLVGTVTTGADGTYRFTNLDGNDADSPPSPINQTDDGYYVVSFGPGTGGVEDADGNPLTDVVLPQDQGVQITDDTGVTAETIDDFHFAQPGQPIGEDTAGGVTLSQSGALNSNGGVLGDERDVQINVATSTGDSSIFRVDTTPSNPFFTVQNGNVTSTVLVQYDGVDNDDVSDNQLDLNVQGFGVNGVDMTGGDSVAGLAIAVKADQVVTDGFIVRMYDVDGNMAEYSQDLTANTVQFLFIPFADFTSSGAMDFTKVGAIEATVDSINSNGGAGVTGLDVEVSVLESQRSNEYIVNGVATISTGSMILGGEVFVDNGGGNNEPNQDNGLLDTDEVSFGGDPIEVVLYDTDPSVGTPTPIATTTVGTDGSYDFSTLTGGGDLGPGTYYVVIPTAQFDSTGPLNGYIGSTVANPGNGGTDTTDDNIDGDNDGVFIDGLGFVSGAITLTAGAEPSGDGNTNTTVDFGVVPTTDLRIDKTIDSSSDLVLGGSASFTVTVQNLGATDATQVQITDVIPGGLTFVSVLDDTGATVSTTSSVDGDGNVVQTFAVPGTLAPGASVTYTINTTIDSSVSIDPINEVIVSGYEVEVDADPNDADRNPGDPLDGPLANNVAVERVDLPLVELTVTKTDGIDSPDTAIAGQQLTYTVSVQNTGNDTAEAIVALDALPAGVTYVSDSGTFTMGSGTFEVISDGGVDDGKLRITFGDLAMNEQEVVTFDVLIDPNFTAPDSLLSNTIVVGGDNVADASATDVTTVAREVDVSVGKLVVASRIPDVRGDDDPSGDIIDNTAPFDVVAGGYVTYQVFASNDGVSTARGVTVTDTLDSGLTLVDGSFDPLTSGATISVNGQDLTFTVPDLAPGESRVFTFEVAIGSDQLDPIDNSAVIATTDPETGDGTANNSATVSIDPDARVDLVLEKTANVQTAVPGRDQVIYTFTISHDDDSLSDAVNVDVSDVLPVGLTGVVIDAPGSTGTPTFDTTTRQLLVEYATIPVGETRTFTVTANVNADATADLVNTAEVVTPGVTDLDPTNNTDSVTVTLTPEYDLQITKAVVGSGDVTPSADVSFTIVVSHDTSDDGTEADNGLSPSLAQGVIVTDVLPDGLTFKSAFVGSTEITPTSTTNGTIILPAFDLAPGATRTITITATADSDATGDLTNNVSLAAADDTQSDNNAASVVVTVVPEAVEADVYVTKTVSATHAQAGSELTYTINVFNDGPSPADAVTVIDTLPTGLTFVSGTGPNGALTANGQTVTVTPLNNAPLASGGTFQFTIIARINEGVTSDLVNSVTVTTTTTQPDNDKADTATATTTIDDASNQISGMVFRDFNNNGIMNGADSGLAGIEILLTGGDLGPNGRTTMTDEDGFYFFDDLVQGDYVVQRLGMPQYYLDGLEQAGTDATPADTGDSIDVTLDGTSLNSAPDNNFALVPYLSYRLCVL
ncbi:beta strand repeat-containing protein [Allorhodopirellula heiligendammensis]|uniref:Cna protein B-type domain protein n=1 Tax=Allorhodopirellula heiligendammensis TaxID=2714739 RepID=A0A5C6C1P3_9BACT|nr:SdrD B-like domain-containing protein [Allorhodopirellula heiligendammensis]TWU18460.1 Cna protein B-type domain protein [Allorhodopirellula heiligendammensis]